MISYTKKVEGGEELDREIALGLPFYLTVRNDEMGERVSTQGQRKLWRTWARAPLS